VLFRSLKALVFWYWGDTLEEAGRLDEALQKYAEARRYEQSLPSNLKGSILLDSGHTEAQAAQTKEAKREAIVLVDLAGNIIRNNPKEDDPYFLHLNLDRYHLTRSASLIAVGRNKDAIKELKLVKAGPEFPRRQVRNAIREAEAHLNLGEYEGVVGLAESGLVIAQKINSEVLVARVEKLYQKLKKSPYKNSTDVARLEYALSKRRSKK